MNPVKELSAKERKQWEQWLITCKQIREGTPKIPVETGAKKQQRIEHLLKPENFEEWINFYFASPDFKPAPLAWFHRQAIDNLFVKKERKHLWEWHRESAKSVFADIFLPIHMLMTGSLTGMILASENEDKAKNLIKDVEAQLRNNPRIIHDFGNFGITGSWIQSFFQTKEGIGFWAFGLSQNPAGVRNAFRRPNLGMVDDADNYQKAKNQILTKQRVDLIKGEFMGCLQKHDRYFIYLNNRIHKEGITAHLAGDINEGDPLDDSFAHIKAYLIEDPKTHQPIYPEGRTEEELLSYYKKRKAKPAWQEYYTLQEAVWKIVDYGPRNALRQLFHKHIDDGGIFDDDNMPWFDPLAISSYDAIIDYCDPAFGESGKGSYKAIVRVGKIGHYYDVLKAWVRTTGEWWTILHEWSEEMRKGVLVAEDQNSGLRIKPRKFQSWVECNSLQRSEMRKTMKLANLKRTVAWFPRYDEEHKGDKIARIEGLEMLFNEQYVRFSTSMQGDKDMMKLREQFKSFPEGKVDGCDAFHGAKTKLDVLHRSSNLNPKTGKYNRNKRKIA